MAPAAAPRASAPRSATSAVRPGTKSWWTSSLTPYATASAVATTGLPVATVNKPARTRNATPCRTLSEPVGKNPRTPPASGVLDSQKMRPPQATAPSHPIRRSLSGRICQLAAQVGLDQRPRLQRPQALAEQPYQLGQRGLLRHVTAGHHARSSQRGPGSVAAHVDAAPEALGGVDDHD